MTAEIIPIFGETGVAHFTVVLEDGEELVGKATLWYQDSNVLEIRDALPQYIYRDMGERVVEVVYFQLSYGGDYENAE